MFGSVRPSRPRTIAHLAAFAGGALVVAGCGVSGGTGQMAALGAGQGASLSEAAQATAELDSFQVAVETVAEDEAGSNALSAEVEAAYDATTGRARMTLSGDAGGPGAGLLAVEVIVDGEVAYVRSALLERLSGGTPWVRFESSAIGQLTGGAASTVDLGAGGALTLLEEAGGELEELGTEEVRGVTTRHVATELDMERVIDQATPDRREELDAGLEALGMSADDLGTVPVEAWIDEAGLLRRFSLRIERGATMTQTFELYGLGEPVAIELPDPDQVGELDLDDLGLESLVGD